MLLRAFSAISTAFSVAVCLFGGAFDTLQWMWLLPLCFAGAFVGLFVLLFLTLYTMAAVIDLSKEQKEDSRFYRWVIDLMAEAAMPILQVRMQTRGLENTPAHGRFLLVCNHLNDMDPVILLHHFRTSQLAFISKRENARLFIVGKLMHRILCQPINRENDREALKTILKCIQLIKEDKASVAVFPEGYTSRDHKFHDFRPGVFKIAQKTGVPIVVCTVTNTYRIFRNAAHLRPTDVSLHLLGVIQPEEYRDITTVALSDRIHAMMAADLGPAYAPEEST